jgi:hypothetical protein
MRLPRRFDDTLMHPPHACEAVDAALLASLRAWCDGGAFPVLTEPLRVATVAPHPGLDAAACVLDGSRELAQMSCWRGLWWRLQILWRELVAGGGMPPGDPWDCGWWRDGSLDPAAGFQPRRATLLMLREPDAAVAAALLATLRARSPSYDRPLRVLVVSAATVAGIAPLQACAPQGQA